jgi:hypothetical protein
MVLSLVPLSFALLLQTPQAAPERFETPPGLAVRTWAGAEHAGGAVALDIDIRGRVWVLRVGDGVSVSILEDTDGDGASDSVQQYRRWSDAKSASGLAVLGERVFASVDGRIVALSDSDGDGAADTEAHWAREPDVAHVGGLLGGPDGKCWLASSSSDAARANFGAHSLDWDGQGLSHFATRAGRAHELALDSFGQVFATSRGSEGELHALNAASGATNGHLRFDVGDPRGLAVYESNFIPELDGRLLVTDAGAGVVWQVETAKRGAGLHFTRRAFLATRTNGEASSASFRPVDVAVGIDGAVFIADAGAADGGEILRVGPDGRRNALPQLRLNVLNGQLSALLNPAANVRASAFELLDAEGEAVFEQLQGVAKARNPRWQARALWLLAGAGTRGRMYTREFLSHENEDLRLVALRSLLARGELATELARRFVGDPSLAVRAEALRSLASTPWDAKAAAVLDLLAPWPSGDAAFVEAAVHAAGSDPGKLREALAAEGSQPGTRWKSAEVAELSARLAASNASK